MALHQVGVVWMGVVATAIVLPMGGHNHPDTPGAVVQPETSGKTKREIGASVPKRDDAAAESIGWKLGAQAWTFRDRTAQDAIQTAASMGIKYMQMYSGQALSTSKPDVKVGADMSAAERDELKKILADAGVKAVSFGVVGFSKDEAAARKTFEFAKAMGFETIATEPDEDAWGVVEKLADEFEIRVACHNHPKPSRYWDPATVLASIKGRSKRLGVCADTGHWKRSGLDPVECLSSMKGLVMELHFKDVAGGKEAGKEMPGAKDKPWGTGECDAAGMLKELHAQGFKGYVFVEYEDGAGKELDANVSQCVAFFDKVAREVVESTKK